MSGHFIKNKSQLPPREFLQNVSSDSYEITDGSSSEERTTFPFQTTPSGHLKVIPEQVVYESKQLSIVAANPKRTKVKIKSDSNKEMSGSTDNSFGPDLLPSQQRVFRSPRRQCEYGDISSEIDMIIDDGRLQNIKMDQKQAVQNITQMNREIKLEKMGFDRDPAIDWSKIDLPPKSDLHKILHHRISNYINPDILIKIGNHEYRCHLLVLQCYSEFFVDNPAPRIELPERDVSKSAFIHIYDWMLHVRGDSYTLLKRDNILEIFMAAQFLKIKELEEQCWAFIDNEDLFSEDKAFMLYLDARALSNTAVMELMVPRIQRFFLTLVASKDFLELVIEEISVFLRSNYICINCEMEVFMSAVRWLMYDWERRQKYLVEVMSCVRFGLISPWQLVDIRRNPDNQEFLIITRNADVSCMIEDGLAYAIVKYWYGHDRSELSHWIEMLRLTEPAPRNWAETHKINDQKGYSTYREFLVDLNKYRKTHIWSNRENRVRSETSDESLITDYGFYDQQK